MTMVFCLHGWSAPRLSSSSGSPERLRGVNGASSGAEITSEWRGPRHTRRTRNGWRRCMRHLNLYMKIQHVKLNKPNYLHCIRIYIYTIVIIYIRLLHTYIIMWIYVAFSGKMMGWGPWTCGKQMWRIYFFKKTLGCDLMANSLEVASKPSTQPITTDRLPEKCRCFCPLWH
jgi:hypothetical protein